MKSSLPNFFVIGAAKSGTTALFDILNQHSQIYLPYKKEPNFFSSETNYSKGLDWYSKTYFKSSSKYPVRGEASPHYLYWSEKTASRIAKINFQQEIKIIVMFRDPVKRAYSHYWMLVHRDLEDLSFPDALDAESDLLNKKHTELSATGSLRYGYFRGGQYATLLRPFLEQFSFENFHFILLDDMKNDFVNMMMSLSKFLGIGTDFCFQAVESNPAYKPRNHQLHHFLHHPSGFAYRMMRSFLKKTPLPFQYELRRRLVTLNLKPSPNPPMDGMVEKQLRIRYRDEIEQLEGIIKRDLSHWKL